MNDSDRSASIRCCRSSSSSSRRTDASMVGHSYNSARQTKKYQTQSRRHWSAATNGKFTKTDESEIPLAALIEHDKGIATPAGYESGLLRVWAARKATQPPPRGYLINTWELVFDIAKGGVCLAWAIQKHVKQGHVSHHSTRWQRLKQTRLKGGDDSGTTVLKWNRRFNSRSRSARACFCTALTAPFKTTKFRARSFLCGAPSSGICGRVVRSAVSRDASVYSSADADVSWSQAIVVDLNKFVSGGRLQLFQLRSRDHRNTGLTD